MAQYSKNTVDVANNSPQVTGNNTLWQNNIKPGDSFTVAGSGVVYEIASVNSDTSLSLSVPYAGQTETTSYAIIRDFTPSFNLPELRQGDIETATVWTRAVRKIDQVLAGAQDAGAITSAGIYPDTTAGLAATTDGDYFFVPDNDEFILYLNSSNSAVEQLKFASLAVAMQYAQDAQQAASDAQTAQQGAELAESNASDSEANALVSENAAAQSEGNAASSATTASQQAGIANDKANEATIDADRAEAAADAAQLSGGVFDDTAEGIANTGDGDYFSTPSGSSNVYLILYKNNAGSATQVAEYPTFVGMRSVIGDVTHITDNGTYTLPTAQPNGARQTYTKNYANTPTIKAGGSDNILCAGQTDTTLDYDFNVQLVLVYNSGTWEVSYE